MGEEGGEGAETFTPTSAPASQFVGINRDDAKARGREDFFSVWIDFL
jgi:hypothetical protein